MNWFDSLCNHPTMLVVPDMEVSRILVILFQEPVVILNAPMNTETSSMCHNYS